MVSDERIVNNYYKQELTTPQFCKLVRYKRTQFTVILIISEHTPAYKTYFVLTFSRPLLRIKCAALWYCFMRNMHCPNQYTSRGSPLLNQTTLSAQNNAALYRC